MLRAGASQAAAQMAQSCFDYGPTGGMIRVEDDRAVQALERAFHAMLRRGGEPLAVPISEEAARAFPRREAPFAGDHRATPWLAVGLDQEGRGTYSLRWLRIATVDRDEEHSLSEMAMLAELSKETGRRGFPIGPTMGRA